MERERVNKIKSELKKRGVFKKINVKYSDIEDIAKVCNCSTYAVMYILRYEREV